MGCKVSKVFWEQSSKTAYFIFRFSRFTTAIDALLRCRRGDMGRENKLFL